MKESLIQQQICNYLSSLGIFFFSIPNEHYGISFAELTKLKKTGLVPGMPDLGILINETIIFFETKSKKGKLSDNQKIIHSKLKELGYCVNSIKSLDEFKNIFSEYISD